MPAATYYETNLVLLHCVDARLDFGPDREVDLEGLEKWRVVGQKAN